MPILPRPRHENYCLLIVGGMTQADAYERAGFVRSPTNACKFNSYPHIQERIAELQRAKNAVIIEPYSKPAVTRDYVLSTLVENIERSMQHKQAVDGDGNPIGEFQWNGAIANKSLELVGKEIGMFIERKMTLHGSLENADPEKMRQLRAMLAREIDGGVVGTFVGKLEDKSET